MRVLSTPRRNAAAAKLALLAGASLALVVVAAVFPMRDGLRSALAGAAVCGYVLFAGRAMELLQGRGCPRLDREAWRRHFLPEKEPGRFRAQLDRNGDVRSHRGDSPTTQARS